MRLFVSLVFLLSLHYLDCTQPLDIDNEYFLRWAATSSSFKSLQSLSSNTLSSSHLDQTFQSLSHSYYSKKNHVLVVIPGFGCQEDRTQIVLNNLMILNHSRAFVSVDCQLFLACEPSPHVRQRLESSCDIQTYEYGSYSHYLKGIVPVLVKQAGFTHVLILLDDAQLSYNYRLDTLINIMDRYALSAISPTVINAVYPSTSCPFCRPRFRLKDSSGFRHSSPSENTSLPFPIIGFTTESIETFATLFTFSAWKCFYSLLQPNLNSAGWSYDRCFKKYCQRKKKSKLIHLGVVDTMLVLHNSPRIQGNTEIDSKTGLPKPLVDRNEWLQQMKMTQYLSTDDIFETIMIGDQVNIYNSTVINE